MSLLPDINTGKGETPVSVAKEWIKQKRVDLIIKWVRDGNDVQQRDESNGNTALHYACKHGIADIVAVLLKKGANPNVANRNGSTPLHLAVTSGIQQVCDMLLRYKATVGVYNNKGQTPLDIAHNNKLENIIVMLSNAAVAEEEQGAAHAVTTTPQGAGAVKASASTPGLGRSTSSTQRTSSRLMTQQQQQQQHQQQQGSRSLSRSSPALVNQQEQQQEEKMSVPQLQLQNSALEGLGDPQQSQQPQHQQQKGQGIKRNSITLPPVNASATSMPQHDQPHEEQERVAPLNPQDVMMMQQQQQQQQQQSSVRMSLRSKSSAVIPSGGSVSPQPKRPINQQQQQGQQKPQRLSKANVAQVSGSSSHSRHSGGEYSTVADYILQQESPSVSAEGQHHITRQQQQQQHHRHQQQRLSVNAASSNSGPTAGSYAVNDLIAELMHQNHLLDQHLNMAPQVRHVLCSVCEADNDGTEPPQRAVYYCEECQNAGEPHLLCEECWGNEHKSRKTRNHARAPVPVVQIGQVGGGIGGGGADSGERGSEGLNNAQDQQSTSSVDARALVMIQQQMLQLIRHLCPKPTANIASQTDVDVALPNAGDVSGVSTVHPSSVSIALQQSSAREGGDSGGAGGGGGGSLDILVLDDSAGVVPQGSHHFVARKPPVLTSTTACQTERGALVESPRPNPVLVKEAQAGLPPMQRVLCESSERAKRVELERDLYAILLEAHRRMLRAATASLGAAESRVVTLERELRAGAQENRELQAAIVAAEAQLAAAKGSVQETTTSRGVQCNETIITSSTGSGETAAAAAASTSVTGLSVECTERGVQVAPQASSFGAQVHMMTPQKDVPAQDNSRSTRQEDAGEEVKNKNASNAPAEGGPPPQQQRNQPPQIPPDAVSIVHGEKHLPGEGKMLLIQWKRPARHQGGDGSAVDASPFEEWVALSAVAHCTAVVQYRQQMASSYRAGEYNGNDHHYGGSSSASSSPHRHHQQQQQHAYSYENQFQQHQQYRREHRAARGGELAPYDHHNNQQRDFGPGSVPITPDREERMRQHLAASPPDNGSGGGGLGDTERLELALQLAALKRINTAPLSRESQRTGGSPSADVVMEHHHHHQHPHPHPHQHQQQGLLPPRRGSSSHAGGGVVGGLSSTEDMLLLENFPSGPVADEGIDDSPDNTGNLAVMNAAREARALGGDEADDGRAQHREAPRSKADVAASNPVPPPPRNAANRDPSPQNRHVEEMAAKASNGGKKETKAQQQQRQQQQQEEDGRVSAPSTAEQDVIRHYEERLRALEEGHAQRRQQRHEHEERLQKLREKQLARDDRRRREIHEEYEAHEQTIHSQQPELEHPLYQTNDRHAALLLHKLHEEIRQAEQEKHDVAMQQRPMEQPGARNLHNNSHHHHPHNHKDGTGVDNESIVSDQQQQNANGNKQVTIVTPSSAPIDQQQQQQPQHEQQAEHQQFISERVTFQKARKSRPQQQETPNSNSSGGDGADSGSQPSSGRAAYEQYYYKQNQQ